MPNYYSSIEVSASGLSAERLAMDVIANNIANANTTRTPEGGAFKRQLVVFAQKSGDVDSGANPDASPVDAVFGPDEPDTTNASDNADAASATPKPNESFDPFDPTAPVKANVEGVEALGIVNDPSPDRLEFDPSNPEADGRGYVHYPNVQIVKEMVDMMAASRAYQANVAAIQETRNMSQSATNLLTS